MSTYFTEQNCKTFHLKNVLFTSSFSLLTVQMLNYVLRVCFKTAGLNLSHKEFFKSTLGQLF